MTSSTIFDPVEFFPVEVVTRIFTLLDAVDICHASLVSHRWRSICDQECVWQNLCQYSWRNKKNILPTIQPRADYSGDCAYRLTQSELKTILGLRQLNSIKGEDPLDLVKLVQQTTPYLTKATANFRSKWKACYAFAQADRHRSSMTMEDICGEWVLKIGKTQKCDLIDVTFDVDYTYYSENTGPLKWDFYGQFVRVNDFPPLKASRTPDWGWRLSCPYFNLYSK